MTALQYPHTPFGFETAPGEKSSDTGHTEREGGECDPTWLLRVYIASDDKVLYDFAVFAGPLRLKPYTGKAPRWPWLVKCSHFHQEGASVQRLLRAGKLLLERQPPRAFGGDPRFLTLAAENTVEEKHQSEKSWGLLTRWIMSLCGI